MRRLLPLLALTLLCRGTLDAEPLDGAWFYRRVVEPTETDTNPATMAWRQVGKGNTPYDGPFSLVRQRQSEGAPHPFEPGADTREMLEHDWEVATTFELTELPAGRFDLVSDSSSPLVEVYFNGTFVGRLDRPSATGWLGERRIPLGPHAKVGRNDLLIRLLAPGPEAARRHAALPRNLPDGPAVTVRAPRMVFGTEVAPPLVAPWIEVNIDDDPFPCRLLESGRVKTDKGEFIEAVVDISAPVKGRLILETRQVGNREPDPIVVASIPLPSEAGRHVLTLPAPPLLLEDGMVLGKEYLGTLFPRSVVPRFEVEGWAERDIRWADRFPKVPRRLNYAPPRVRLDPGAPGRPACLVSEGLRHPIRGVVVVPSRLEYGPPLHPHGNDANTAAQLIRDGFNLVRVWGGGAQARDDLLGDCWAHGLPVWVELPFVRGLFPGDESFAAEAEREVDEYLRFLQRFPCVVAISGSAETARYRLGDVIPGLRNARETAEVRADQARLFDQRLRALVARRLPHVTYLPYGETLGSGDMTVRTAVSAPSPLTADRWKLGNGLRWPEGRGGELELGRRLGEAGLRNPGEELLGFASRWLQAEDLRLQLDRVRARGPEEGYVLWHLNDGWPGATSSLSDSEGVEKPAYFIARRANAPEGVRLAFEGAAATAQATGKALDLSLRILDAGGKILAVQQGAGPLRAAFPPGAAYAVAENGPHRVIRPLPAFFLPDDPRLGRSAYSISSEAPAKGEFAVTHLLTVKAEGVVVGLCLEPTRANAWSRDGMIDLLPGERHEFRASIPKDCRDWREAFKARSWHDLAGK